MENLEQPKIDIKLIQEKANEAAEKAYLSAIEDYYTSYQSPYKKMIKSELEKQKMSYAMELPDVMAKINEALSNEIDIIANNAIANSYIPMVTNSLIGLEKEITLSWFLKETINELDPEEDVFDEFSFSFNEHPDYGWLECCLVTPNSNYKFNLHNVTIKKGDKQKYKLLSFPRHRSKEGYNSKMVIYKEGVKIEMPFAPGILQDKVLNLFFKMMFSDSTITMDCDGFSEDMFPDKDYCHC